MSQNTSQSDEDDYPKAMLIEPDEWSRKHGYLSQLRVMHNPGQSFSLHLTPDGLQAIVDQAYSQHGISASEATAKELDRLAEDMAGRVDWSDGRNNYGDNEAYEADARTLRARAEVIRNG